MLLCDRIDDLYYFDCCVLELGIDSRIWLDWFLIQSTERILSRCDSSFSILSNVSASSCIELLEIIYSN